MKDPNKSFLKQDHYDWENHYNGATCNDCGRKHSTVDCPHAGRDFDDDDVKFMDEEWEERAQEYKKEQSRK